MKRFAFTFCITFLFLNSCVSSGKVGNGTGGTNRYDAKGLKTGAWVMYDTIADIHLSLYPILGHGTSPTDVNRTQEKRDTSYMIVKSEGVYKLGKPDGVWKFTMHDILRKEITYQQGMLQKATIYNPQGKPRFTGYTNPVEESFMFEEFDIEGKKIKSGSVPLELLQIESLNRMFF